MNSLQEFQGYIINSLFLPAETQVAWDNPRVVTALRVRHPQTFVLREPSFLNAECLHPEAQQAFPIPKEGSTHKSPRPS